MDPWYHYERGDPIDAAFILLHYAHMSGHDDVSALWELLTEANASVFGIGDNASGLEPGAAGSLVVYDSPTAFDVLRTRAPRTLVLKDGRQIARTEPATTHVLREEGERVVDFHR